MESVEAIRLRGPPWLFMGTVRLGLAGIFMAKCSKTILLSGSLFALISFLCVIFLWQNSQNFCVELGVNFWGANRSGYFTK